MGSTKKVQYNQYELDIANLFKALGHPARIRILELLLKTDDLNINRLSYELELSGPTTSHHTNILYETGLIGQCVTRNGCLFKIHPETIDYIENHLDWLRNCLDSKNRNFDITYFKPMLRPGF